MKTVEYFNEEYEDWEDIEWPDVVSGTTIRMYAEDGTPLTRSTNIFEMDTASDSYETTISGVWEVQIYDPDINNISYKKSE